MQPSPGGSGPSTHRPDQSSPGFVSRTLSVSQADALAHGRRRFRAGNDPSIVRRGRSHRKYGRRGSREVSTWADTMARTAPYRVIRTERRSSSQKKSCSATKTQRKKKEKKKWNAEKQAVRLREAQFCLGLADGCGIDAIAKVQRSCVSSPNTGENITIKLKGLPTGVNKIMCYSSSIGDVLFRKTSEAVAGAHRSSSKPWKQMKTQRFIVYVLERIERGFQRYEAGQQSLYRMKKETQKRIEKVSHSSNGTSFTF